MLIRERTEELEKKLLSPKAAFSADAKRSREENGRSHAHEISARQGPYSPQQFFPPAET